MKVSLNLLKLFRKKCRLFSGHGVYLYFAVQTAATLHSTQIKVIFRNGHKKNTLGPKT